jgi:hypothetical protein
MQATMDSMDVMTLNPISLCTAPHRDDMEAQLSVSLEMPDCGQGI